MLKINDYSLGHPASLHQRASPMLYVVGSRETQMGHICPLLLELKPRCLRQAWTDIRSYSSGHTLGMSCSQASFWQLQGCTWGGGGLAFCFIRRLQLLLSDGPM